MVAYSPMFWRVSLACFLANAQVHKTDTRRVSVRPGSSNLDTLGAALRLFLRAHPAPALACFRYSHVSAECICIVQGVAAANRAPSSDLKSRRGRPSGQDQHSSVTSQMCCASGSQANVLHPAECDW